MYRWMDGEVDGQRDGLHDQSGGHISNSIQQDTRDRGPKY